MGLFNENDRKSWLKGIVRSTSAWMYEIAPKELGIKARRTQLPRSSILGELPSACKSYALLWFITVMLLGGCVSTLEKKNKAELGQLYANMGLEYLRSGKYDSAKDRLLKSIENDPDYAPAHHYLAQTYVQLGDGEQAQRHYENALKLNDTDPFLQNNYAVFLCNAGKIDDAEALFIKLSKNANYSASHLLYENLGNCVYRGSSPAQQARAETYFKQALDHDPKLIVSLSRMAEINLKKNKYFKARAYLERFMALEAYTPEMLLLGVKVEQQLGDRKMMTYYRNLLLERFGRSSQARAAFRIK